MMDSTASPTKEDFTLDAKEQAAIERQALTSESTDKPEAIKKEYGRLLQMFWLLVISILLLIATLTWMEYEQTLKYQAALNETVTAGAPVLNLEQKEEAVLPEVNSSATKVKTTSTIPVHTATPSTKTTVPAVGKKNTPKMGSGSTATGKKSSTTPPTMTSSPRTNQMNVKKPMTMVAAGGGRMKSIGSTAPIVAKATISPIQTEDPALAQVVYIQQEVPPATPTTQPPVPPPASMGTKPATGATSIGTKPATGGSKPAARGSTGAKTQANGGIPKGMSGIKTANPKAANGMAMTMAMAKAMTKGQKRVPAAQPAKAAALENKAAATETPDQPSSTEAPKEEGFLQSIWHNIAPGAPRVERTESEAAEHPANLRGSPEGATGGNGGGRV